MEAKEARKTLKKVVDALTIMDVLDYLKDRCQTEAANSEHSSYVQRKYNYLYISLRGLIDTINVVSSTFGA